MNEWSAIEWIRLLKLERHPEGGYFRQTYRAAESVLAEALPERYGSDRAFSTAIYFLLESSDFSAFHRLKSDEIWHFYNGSSLTLHLLTPEGDYQILHLGPDGLNGESFQVVLPAGVWFGAQVDDPDSYALVGCTVAPGFDFRDFELAAGAQLTRQYPAQAALIQELTR